MCAAMFISPGIPSYLGTFKFSEEQGKVGEMENALKCLFNSIMNALHLPFHLGCPVILFCGFLKGCFKYLIDFIN